MQRVERRHRLLEHDADAVAAQLAQLGVVPADELGAVEAHAARPFVSATVLGELLAGFAAGTRQSKSRAERARFLDSARVEILPMTPQTADTYALVYAGLRRKGQPIPANDLWIAASALEHGAALLTRDAHFARIDGFRSGQRLEDHLP